MTGATSAGELGLLASLEAPFFTDTERIETMFLATLSRLPTEEEAGLFAQFLGSSTTAEQTLIARSDLLWVLLNTAECSVCP